MNQDHFFIKPLFLKNGIKVILRLFLARKSCAIVLVTIQVIPIECHVAMEALMSFPRKLKHRIKKMVIPMMKLKSLLSNLMLS